MKQIVICVVYNACVQISIPGLPSVLQSDNLFHASLAVMTRVNKNGKKIDCA